MKGGAAVCVGRVVFLSVLVLMALQAAYYYPQLPPVVVSHFDALGHANGCMPRQAMLVFQFVLGGVFFLLSWLMPSLMLDIPARFISLPNKKYWLDPARKPLTVAYIQDMMAWTGSAALLLVMVMQQMLIHSNLARSFELPLPGVLFTLGAFVVFNIVWSVVFIRKFLIKGR